MKAAILDMGLKGPLLSAVHLHCMDYYWSWWHGCLKNSCSKYDTKGVLGLSKTNMAYVG